MLASVSQVLLLLATIEVSMSQVKPYQSCFMSCCFEAFSLPLSPIHPSSYCLVFPKLLWDLEIIYPRNGYKGYYLYKTGYETVDYLIDCWNTCRPNNNLRTKVDEEMWYVLRWNQTYSGSGYTSMVYTLLDPASICNGKKCQAIILNYELAICQTKNIQIAPANFKNGLMGTYTEVETKPYTPICQLNDKHEYCTALARHISSQESSSPVGLTPELDCKTNKTKWILKLYPCRIALSFVKKWGKMVCGKTPEYLYIGISEGGRDYGHKLLEEGVCSQETNICRLKEWNNWYHAVYISDRIYTTAISLSVNCNDYKESETVAFENWDYDSFYFIDIAAAFTADLNATTKHKFNKTVEGLMEDMFKVDSTYSSSTRIMTLYHTEHYASIVKNQVCPSDSTQKNEMALYVSVPLVILMIAVILLGYFIHRHRSAATKKATVLNTVDSISGYTPFPHKPSVADRFEIDHRRLELYKEETLGIGAFGKVYKGRIKGIVKTSENRSSIEMAENITVAVKQCYEFADATVKQSFLKEIRVMKELHRHPYLANILYSISIHEPYSLVLEFCAGGDLLQFLRDSSEYLEDLGDNASDNFDTSKVLLFQDVVQIGFEIADGMAYVASKGFVHRDLAARNVLLTDQKHVKIADFGLCRRVHASSDVYTTKGGKLPIKWMALESMTKYQFTSKSDVWSYGIVLYEIVTLGAEPYRDVIPADGDFRRAIVQHLRAGKRLEKPENCPEELKQVMDNAWKEDPEDRSSFDEIKELMRKLVETFHDTNDTYIDRYVDVLHSSTV